MKKFSIVLSMLLIIFLVSCSSNFTPLYLNDEIIPVEDERFTEISLSDSQITYFENNTVTDFVEYKDGFLMVFYESTYTEKYISYFAFDEVLWTIGPFRAVYDVEVLHDDVFRFLYGFELGDSMTGFFNSSGDEIINIKNLLEDMKDTPDNGWLVIDSEAPGFEIGENYSLLKINSNYESEIIMEFSNMSFVTIDKLLESTYIVETRSTKDAYAFYIFDYMGNILYSEDHSIRYDILKDGYLIKDYATDSVYKVDKEFNEIWRVEIGHYQINLYEIRDNSIIISFRNSDDDGYIEIFNDGSYQILENYIYVHLSKTFIYFENGNRLGTYIQDRRYYLTLIDEDHDIIWMTESYDKIYSAFVNGDTIYMNANINDKYYLVILDSDGLEIERKKIQKPIIDITSDNRFLSYYAYSWRPLNSHGAIYDINMNQIWISSKEYDTHFCFRGFMSECIDPPIDDTKEYFGGIEVTNTGNIVITYYKLTVPLEPSFNSRDIIKYIDIYSQDGTLIMNYDEKYSQMKVLYSTEDSIFVYAKNLDEEEVFLRIDVEGNILSEAKILHIQEYAYYLDYYLLQDGKAYRFRYF